jgi:membrane protease YdiL (CAAX protease family)
MCFSNSLDRLECVWPRFALAFVRDCSKFSIFSNVNGLIPFISSVIIFPVAEELVFRSGVCRLLVERIGPVAGIFLQALLFGSVHLATPLHMAVGFIGGIVLGMVYIYSRSNASMCGVLIFDCGLKAVQSP